MIKKTVLLTVIALLLLSVNSNAEDIKCSPELTGQPLADCIEKAYAENPKLEEADIIIVTHNKNFHPYIIRERFPNKKVFITYPDSRFKVFKGVVKAYAGVDTDKTEKVENNGYKIGVLGLEFGQFHYKITLKVSNADLEKTFTAEAEGPQAEEIKKKWDNMTAEEKKGIMVALRKSAKINAEVDIINQIVNWIEKEEAIKAKKISTVSK
jgi:hypothetical protein